MDSWGEVAGKEPSRALLCEDLEGWARGKGGRLGREGMYELWQIHVAVWQKATQHCKHLKRKQTQKENRPVVSW